MPEIRFTYLKLEGFELWGKEYQDGSWKLRVFAEENRRIETYESVSPDSLPAGKRAGEQEAMRAALSAWRKNKAGRHL
jgi:hypothetical protein